MYYTIKILLTMSWNMSNYQFSINYIKTTYKGFECHGLFSSSTNFEVQETNNLITLIDFILHAEHWIEIPY